MAISPLNYPGNKARSLNEIIGILPKNIDIFVDAFCGSGIISANSDSKFIIQNDLNKHTIELTEYLYVHTGDEVIATMDGIIKKYGFSDSTKNKYVEKKHEGLSKINKVPFAKLKEDYNKTKNVDLLFALIIFGFNHYLRFNNKDEFNVPVGKVDYSNSLRKKTLEFCELLKTKNIVFSNLDYKTSDLYKKCTENSVVYFDPPYLVTKAPYNVGWNDKDDKELMNLFDRLNDKGIKVCMSNVFLSNGKKNVPLINWSEKYNVHYLKRQYRNANYQKINITDSIEVLITNF